MTRRSDEQGAALITVVALTAVLTLLASVVLTYAVNSLPNARHHQDWNAALAAAEAGLDDYLARLNRNPTYYQLATPDNPHGDVALTGWAELPDSEGAYHYQVDTSRVGPEGTVTVTSIGRVRDATRTVQSTFRPTGFLDFIYFSDYESTDPATTNFEDGAACERYYGEGSRNRDLYCAPLIRWVTADVVQGPMHSNDSLLIDGDPQFLGPVTTNWRGTNPDAPNNQLWRTDYSRFQYSGNQNWENFTTRSTRHESYDSQPTFADGIEFAEKVSMPPTNLEISEQTTSVTGGCMYYGPTYIHIDGDRMRVSSPQSATGPPSGGIPTNAHCRGTGVADTGWVDLPPNGVIYVANATHASVPTCNRTHHPLSLPNSGDVSSYPCTAGDVFVWGELDGQLTIAAQNDVYIVADLTYAGGYEQSDDLLGLVADRYVQLWHPVSYSAGATSGGSNQPHTGSGIRPYLGNQRPPATNSARTWESPTIHAAILSLNHSFRVQNHQYGQPYNNGELSVRGAIAQKFRGPVGTSRRLLDGTIEKASGYDKDYVYDYRLQYLSPPYFIEPVEAQWRQRTWAEIRTPADLPPRD